MMSKTWLLIILRLACLWKQRRKKFVNIRNEEKRKKKKIRKKSNRFIWREKREKGVKKEENLGKIWCCQGNREVKPKNRIFTKNTIFRPKHLWKKSKEKKRKTKKVFFLWIAWFSARWRAQQGAIWNSKCRDREKLYTWTQKAASVDENTAWLGTMERGEKKKLWKKKRRWWNESWKKKNPLKKVVVIGKGRERIWIFFMLCDHFLF